MHDFDPSEDGELVVLPLVFDPETEENGDRATLAFTAQWDEPWGSLCEECVEPEVGLEALIFFLEPFQFVTALPQNDAKDPRISYTLALPRNRPAAIAFASTSGSALTPERIHMQIDLAEATLASSVIEFGAPTVVGHKNTNGISVGASAWFNTPEGMRAMNEGFGLSYPIPLSPILGFDGGFSILDFIADGEPLITPSSVGGIPILFDDVGNRYEEPRFLENPTIVAADGSLTSSFGYQSSKFQYPFFFGTSCSAPNAAAASALILEAVGAAVPPAELRQRLIDSCVDMDDPFENGLQEDPSDPLFSTGFDVASGHGLIQIDQAVEQVIREKGIAPISVEASGRENDRAVWAIENPNTFGVEVRFYSFRPIFLEGEESSSLNVRDTIVPPGDSLSTLVSRGVIWGS